MPGENTAWPCLYQPPRESDTPLSTFHKGATPHCGHCYRCAYDAKYQADRLISKYDPHAVLVFVDGCCLGNGSDYPRAGAGFIDSHNPGHYTGGHYRLKNYGVDGRWCKQTNNRAELLAVIAALRIADWTRENVRRLVIATDATYVANGCTKLIFQWENNGWCTRAGGPVVNGDLWWLIKELLYDWSDRGLQVEFWRIPRELNIMADTFAKRGAALYEVDDWDDRRCRGD